MTFLFRSYQNPQNHRKINIFPRISLHNEKKIQIRKFYIFFSTTFLHKNRFPITKNTWNPRKYHFCYSLCYQVVLKFNNVIHKTVSLFEAISLRTGAQSRYRRLPIFPWWIDSDRYSGSSLSNIYRIRYVLQCLDRLMTSKTVKSFEGVEQARGDNKVR